MSTRIAHPSGDPSSVPPFLSEADFRALIARITRLTNRRGYTQVNVNSTWGCSVRWARNRASTSAETRDTTLRIMRGSDPRFNGSLGEVTLNQIDEVSLATAIQWAEQMWRMNPGTIESKEYTYAPPALVYPQTAIWSDPTYTMTSDQRSTMVNQLIAGAEQGGMLSAGYFNAGAGATQLALADGRMLYARYTFAQCSLTVRDPDGTSSGWAGATSYDWSHIDAQKLAAVALDKCLRSRNPVRIEPGRYTLIMEPQATYELIGLLWSDLDLKKEEIELPGKMQLPFHAGTRRYQVSQWGSPETIGTTKIGQRVLDPRITLSFDPEDPALGWVPFTGQGDPFEPVTWIENGVLKTLSYPRVVGPSGGLDPGGKPLSSSFRMSGGPTSIDEMIATTQRGLIVTRFSGVSVLEPSSLLAAGMTRDGLWLIENGKVSHAVKNLRFTESPLFAFNNVEQMGTPVPVFNIGTTIPLGSPAIVPPVKVSDFSFTSLSDAV